MSEGHLDGYGYPCIFGDILKGMEAQQDDDSMAEGKDEPSQYDDSLPSIKPINPNVRARKLEVNAAAKALLEDDLANGVARDPQKRVRGKQPPQKTINFKAKVVHQWEVDAQEAYASKRAKCTGPKEDEPKTDGLQKMQKRKCTGPKEDEPRTACKRCIKNADAVILSAFGSSSATTGRFEIQGRCQLADGSMKTIGILGFLEQEPVGEHVWKVLLKKMNDAGGEHTKGEMMILRDQLIAAARQGNLAD